MIRVRVWSGVGLQGRDWTYVVFDTGKPEGRQLLAMGTGHDWRPTLDRGIKRARQLTAIRPPGGWAQ